MSFHETSAAERLSRTPKRARAPPELCFSHRKGRELPYSCDFLTERGESSPTAAHFSTERGENSPTAALFPPKGACTLHSMKKKGCRDKISPTNHTTLFAIFLSALNQATKSRKTHCPSTTSFTSFARYALNFLHHQPYCLAQEHSPGLVSVRDLHKTASTKPRPCLITKTCNPPLAIHCILFLAFSYALLHPSPLHIRSSLHCPVVCCVGHCYDGAIQACCSYSE